MDNMKRIRTSLIGVLLSLSVLISGCDAISFILDRDLILEVSGQLEERDISITSVLTCRPYMTPTGRWREKEKIWRADRISFPLPVGDGRTLHVIAPSSVTGS